MKRVGFFNKLAAVVGWMFAALAVVCLCIYAVPFFQELLSFGVADWQHALQSALAMPVAIVAMLLLIGCVVLLVHNLFSDSDNAATRADDGIDPTFPWFTANATIEQQKRFEHDLRQLCANCTKGSKGTVGPLVSWLLQQQKDGLIALPDNQTQIYQLLAEHYGFALSKQAFSAAMP